MPGAAVAVFSIKLAVCQEFVSMNESSYGDRIEFHHDLEVMEVDFSDVTFDNSRMVDEFYDEIERQIETTGRDWYFLV
ncbi:MAG: hypothetical protein DWQ08_13330, partial [Proteobacteria bacterium]